MTEQESYEAAALAELELENAELYSVNSYLEKRLRVAEAMANDPIDGPGYLSGYFAGIVSGLVVAFLIFLLV